MRPDKELAAIVAATLGVAKGTCPFVIRAESTEEAAKLKALLKGKKGSSLMTVRVGPAAAPKLSPP